MNFNSLIPKDYIERDIEGAILRFLEDREIIVIRGPRQSGKSTLLKKIACLLRRKHGPQSVFFIDFEDEMEQLKFEKTPREYLEFYLDGSGKVFFLLDEIQYIKKGGKILKLLMESYPRVKFIVSGSSSLDINKLGEYLVGRAVFFELYPFCFGEFLKAKDNRLYSEYRRQRFVIDKPRVVDSIHKDKLNLYLREYLTFGGYPRIVLEKDRSKKIILLKNLFSTYIEKDIIKLYGIKYREKAITLLKYLGSTIGNLLNFNDLGQIASSSFKETKELISIFEETYVIRRILPFHKNLVTELKKNPKIYFIDTGLRNVLLERFEFSDEEWGRLLENYGFLVNKDRLLNFWRTTAKAEVDFIVKDKLFPLEIKAVPKVSRSLLSYIEAYRPETAAILNLDQSKTTKKGQTKIFIIPITLV